MIADTSYSVDEEHTHCWHQGCERARCAHLAAEAAPS